VFEFFNTIVVYSTCGSVKMGAKLKILRLPNSISTQYGSVPRHEPATIERGLNIIIPTACGHCPLGKLFGFNYSICLRLLQFLGELEGKMCDYFTTARNP
jgi:hypothetical protein